MSHDKLAYEWIKFWSVKTFVFYVELYPEPGPNDHGVCENVKYRRKAYWFNSTGKFIIDNEHGYLSGDKWKWFNKQHFPFDFGREWTVKSLTKGVTDNVKQYTVPEGVTRGRHVRILHVQPAYKLLAENSPSGITVEKQAPQPHQHTRIEESYQPRTTPAKYHGFTSN